MPQPLQFASLSRRRWLGLAGISASLSACAKRRPVVVYVNSYHEGNGSSDAILLGIREGLAGRELDLEVFFLDGKRNPEGLPAAARKALEAIRLRQPGVILVSDDDAMLHLVVPYLRDGPTPVLFCGVNWSADIYEVPNRFVTGMLEVLPVKETIDIVQAQRPEAKELFVLSEDSLAERKNRRYMDPIYWSEGLSTTYGLVKDFNSWKKAFTWANKNTDLIFFVTHGAIQGWNEGDAIAHIQADIRVPVFTCDAWMMRYCVVGRVKVAREPGDWMATQALRVLDGVRPEEIPLARNRESRVLGNPDLAARISFALPAQAEV